MKLFRIFSVAVALFLSVNVCAADTEEKKTEVSNQQQNEEGAGALEAGLAMDVYLSSGNQVDGGVVGTHSSFSCLACPSVSRAQCTRWVRHNKVSCGLLSVLTVATAALLVSGLAGAF